MTRLQLALLMLGISFYTVNCYKSIGEIRHNVNARKWLFKYGYKSTYNEKIPLKDLEDSIKNLQRYANLPETGKLDDATLKQMTIPRCGHSDPLLEIKHRGRRYIHQGSTWKPLFAKTGKHELKWTLLNTGSQQLTHDTVLKIMRQAFGYWQDIVPINFIEIPKELVGKKTEYNLENIEIHVKFFKGVHNDPYAFDGPGGTLAHAFYPHSNRGLSGDVHFDDAEEFTYKSPRGRNLLWVATHELGHALGLEHSNIQTAVMYPWYTEYKPGFTLNQDDIDGLQSLYGVRPGYKSTAAITTTTTTTTPPPPTKPSIYNKQCPKNIGTITAFYYSPRYRQIVGFTNTDKIYLFGYKRSIPVLDRNSYIQRSKVPDNINAVFTTKVDGKQSQIIFAGKKYYVFNEFAKRDGPFSIHKGEGPFKLKFESSVKTIDAALTWYRNGRTYFFSGTQYWRFDNGRKRFDRGYPKPIKGNWKGLPDKIDAAYSSGTQKKTFFISGNKYYEFNDKMIRNELVLPVEKFMLCKGAGDEFGNFATGSILVGRTSMKRRGGGKP